MKRYAVLMDVPVGSNGGWRWVVHAECDTLMEAVLQREEIVSRHSSGPPLIVEVIPPIDAYAMAHREAEAAKIQAAYGKPRA